MSVRDWKVEDSELREKTEAWARVVDDFNKAAQQEFCRPTLYDITRAEQREYNRAMSKRVDDLMTGGTTMANYEKLIYIYEIFAVYAENPDMPLIIRPKVAYVGAFDDEEARIKSGIYRVIDATKKEPTTEPLDPRYITVVCRRIAEITKFNRDE